MINDNSNINLSQSENFLNHKQMLKQGIEPMLSNIQSNFLSQNPVVEGMTTGVVSNRRYRLLREAEEGGVEAGAGGALPTTHDGSAGDALLLATRDGSTILVQEIEEKKDEFDEIIATYQEKKEVLQRANSEYFAYIKSLNENDNTYNNKILINEDNHQGAVIYNPKDLDFLTYIDSLPNSKFPIFAKCAKVAVYYGITNDSYGKAENIKPVIDWYNKNVLTDNKFNTLPQPMLGSQAMNLLSEYKNTKWPKTFPEGPNYSCNVQKCTQKEASDVCKEMGGRICTFNEMDKAFNGNMRGATGKHWDNCDAGWVLKDGKPKKTPYLWASAKSRVGGFTDTISGVLMNKGGVGVKKVMNSSDPIKSQCGTKTGANSVPTSTGKSGVFCCKENEICQNLSTDIGIWSEDGKVQHATDINIGNGYNITPELWKWICPDVKNIQPDITSKSYLGTVDDMAQNETETSFKKVTAIRPSQDQKGWWATKGKVYYPERYYVNNYGVKQKINTDRIVGLISTTNNDISFNIYLSELDKLGEKCNGTWIKERVSGAVIASLPGGGAPITPTLRSAENVRCPEPPSNCKNWNDATWYSSGNPCQGKADGTYVKNCNALGICLAEKAASVQERPATGPNVPRKKAVCPKTHPYPTTDVYGIGKNKTLCCDERWNHRTGTCGGETNVSLDEVLRSAAVWAKDVVPTDAEAIATKTGILGECNGVGVRTKPKGGGGCWGDTNNADFEVHWCYNPSLSAGINEETISCGYAGINIKLKDEPRYAWVDSLGKKHVYKNTKIYNSRDRISCPANYTEVSQDIWDAIPTEGTITSNNYICKYNNNILYQTVQTAYKDLKRYTVIVNNRIISLEEVDNRISNKLVTLQKNITTDMSTMNKNMNTIEKLKLLQDTAVGKEESTSLLMHSNKMQLIVWLIISLLLLVYAIYSIHSGITATPLHIIMLIVCTVILFILVRKMYLSRII